MGALVAERPTKVQVTPSSASPLPPSPHPGHAPHQELFCLAEHLQRDQTVVELANLLYNLEPSPSPEMPTGVKLALTWNSFPRASRSMVWSRAEGGPEVGEGQAGQWVQLPQRIPQHDILRRDARRRMLGGRQGSWQAGGSGQPGRY